MTETPDEDLAREAAAGSREAFRTLVERHGSRVRSVLAQGLGDGHQAEDLAQEVWLKVHRALPRFRPEGRFRPWLFTIAYNQLRDALRSRARSKVVYLDDFRDDGGAPASDTEAAEREQRLQVHQALGTVAEPFRGAVSLVDIGGLAYADAARLLGCTVGTVKSRVHRGRMAFRDAWEGLHRGASARQGDLP